MQAVPDSGKRARHNVWQATGQSTRNPIKLPVALNNTGIYVNNLRFKYRNDGALAHCDLEELK